MCEPNRATGEVELSIVAPCYNEAAVLNEFCQRASAAAEATFPGFYEIILVDDGSSDETWEIIRAQARRDDRIVGVRLMRNHGHQAAATAGISLTRGQRVLLIDADLQDPPELLNEMVTLMNDGADVVYGQRITRAAETWFKKASASMFYRLLTRYSTVTIPQDTGDFRLMNRRVVDILMIMPERQRFIRGMVSWIGGKQVAMRYHRRGRFAGESKYPLMKMVTFAADAITSFSAAPLRLASYLGFAAALTATALLLYILASWAAGRTVAGWASLMTIVAFFGAIQLIVLGIMGEYIGRIFEEIKRRPGFLIDQLIRSEQTLTVPVDFSDLSLRARRDICSNIWEQESSPITEGQLACFSKPSSSA